MMPPLLALVQILPNSTHRGVRLWVPLFLIWLLLLPFVLVLLPVYFVVCAAIDLAPFHTLGSMLLLLGSLAGMHVEVESPSAAVLIHVY